MNAATGIQPCIKGFEISPEPVGPQYRRLA
jgi:hypothetical protein